MKCEEVRLKIFFLIKAGLKFKFGIIGLDNKVGIIELNKCLTLQKRGRRGNTPLVT